MRRIAFAIPMVLIGAAVSPLAAAPLPTPPGRLPPGAECRSAIERAERLYGLPAHLLGAIGIVESGRRSPQGRVDPWPWSINVEGADSVFDSKAAAMAQVSALLAAGTRSIDVGCLQVNLMYHPDAFGSLDQAFDPWQNADYAARFLVQLHAQTGSWQAATASYHSATPEIGGPYAAKVQAALAREATPALPYGALPGGALAGSALPGLASNPPGTMAPSYGAIGRTGIEMAMPAPRSRSLAMSAATGRGLDAYRLYPTRLMPALLRR